MKKIISIVLALTISLAASAGGHNSRRGATPHIYHAPVSHFYHARVSHVYHGRATRVYIRPSIGLGYYLGGTYWGLGYPYYGFEYPYYRYPNSSGSMPYVLSLRIKSIKKDYRLQIKETRRNRTISRNERRADVTQLKQDREQAVINAEMNYRPGKE